MNTTRPLVIAVGLILGGRLAFAQDMSRYRYVLESSLDSVIAARGARAADAKTLAEQRKKEAGDANAARDKTRIANRAAFRP